MIVVLWVLAGSLGMVFLGAGAIKLLRSKAQLDEGGMHWTQDFKEGGVKAIGAAEMAAGLALIVPLATRSVEILVPAAAFGVALLMAGATLIHRRRGEGIALTIGLGAAALITFAVGLAHALG